MEKLAKLKEQETGLIEDLEIVHTDNIDKLADYYCDINDAKRQLRKEEEQIIERRRIFNSDKEVYKKIKEKMESEKITSVPMLFENKYPIFKFMESSNILYTDEEYEVYLSIYNEMYPKKDINNPYVPHNINYLADGEQEKYRDVCTKHQDIISDFIEKNCKKEVKNFKSVDEVLDNISDDDSDSI